MSHSFSLFNFITSSVFLAHGSCGKCTRKKVVLQLNSTRVRWTENADILFLHPRSLSLRSFDNDYFHVFYFTLFFFLLSVPCSCLNFTFILFIFMFTLMGVHVCDAYSFIFNWQIKLCTILDDSKTSDYQEDHVIFCFSREVKAAGWTHDLIAFNSFFFFSFTASLPPMCLFYWTSRIEILTSRFHDISFSLLYSCEKIIYKKRNNNFFK